MVAAGDEVNASDITALEDLTINRPMVRLVQASAQSMADNTATAISFTTEELDTNGFHDPVTNNTRLTPNVAGWYDVRGTYFSATLTTPVDIFVYLRKNLSPVPSGARIGIGAALPSVSAQALIEFNGSTDYVELVGTQNSAGAANTSVSGYATSTLEMRFVSNS